MRTLDESGQVGPAFVLFFLILMGALAILLFTPIMDEIQQVQSDQIANGEPVSTSRIDTMNTLNTMWEVLPFIVVVMAGLWYWIVSLRERDGTL